MVQVKAYHLPPTDRIPNSHFPLLHYTGALGETTKCDAGKAFDLFHSNGWVINWIFRYGETQMSHYHSQAHECMAVLTGNATIRFGVADTSLDMHANTYGSDFEAGGVELKAKPGDVFLIPAGVAHKTYQASPSAEFKLLTPGNARGIDAPDPRKALQEIDLEGFTMLGAYPVGVDWDSLQGSKDHSDWQQTWNTPKPKTDPTLGTASEGLCGLWKSSKAQL